jgi:hypothetical protein
MPETEVETPAVPATETVKEEAVKADETKEEKKDQEKTGDESKETKTEKKKEKKVKEPAAPPPPAVHKKDFEKDVVYVYQFNRMAAVPSISPACLKLETWIKLNGIKYEVSRASSGLSIFQLRATCRVLPPPPPSIMIQLLCESHRRQVCQAHRFTWPPRSISITFICVYVRIT